MATKKTATKAATPKATKTKVTPPRQENTLSYCEAHGCEFTDFGVSQPANGGKLEMCIRCHTPRLTPAHIIEARQQAVYQPPAFAGDMQSLWDMPIPGKLVERERRAATRKANRMQRNQK